MYEYKYNIYLQNVVECKCKGAENGIIKQSTWLYLITYT